MNKVTMTVIGAGTMGHSLALLFARAGMQVQLADISSETLEKAMRTIAALNANMETLSATGSVLEHRAEESTETVLQRITPSTDVVDATAQSSHILEVIVEQPEAKRTLFRQLEPVLAPDAVLMSNTSVLNVFTLVPPSLLARTVMTHYFIPPHLIPLVEIVGNAENPPELVPSLTNWLRDMALVPVVLKRFARGFLINRIQRAMNREIFQLLEDGVADAEAIDTAISATLGLRLPVMRYLERCDHTGLDLVLSNYNQEPLGLANDEKPPAVLRHMVEAGTLGLKSGKGFYEYNDRSQEDLLRERDTKLIKMRGVLRELGMFQTS